MFVNCAFATQIPSLHRQGLAISNRAKENMIGFGLAKANLRKAKDSTFTMQAVVDPADPETKKKVTLLAGDFATKNKSPFWRHQPPFTDMSILLGSITCAFRPMFLVHSHFVICAHDSRNNAAHNLSLGWWGNSWELKVADRTGR